MSAPDKTTAELLELARLTQELAAATRRDLLALEIRILGDLKTLAQIQAATLADMSRRVCALDERGDNVVAGPWMTGGGPAGGRA